MYSLNPLYVQFIIYHLLKNIKGMSPADKIMLKEIFDSIYPGPEGEVILSAFEICQIEWDFIPPTKESE